jgi:hypothetical protein
LRAGYDRRQHWEKNTRGNRSEDMGRGDITRKKGLALEGLHVEDHGSAQKEPREAAEMPPKI